MSIRQTQKKYCSRAMIVSIVVGLVLIFLGQKTMCKGLILGTLFSIFNFILMGETLPSRIMQTSKIRRFLSPGSVLFRHLLLAVPVVIGIRSDAFHLVAVIGGVFSVQLMIFLDHLVMLRDIGKTTDIG